MVDLDEFDGKPKAMAKGWFCTKLYGKVLIAQIMNKMGKGLVV